MRFYLFCLYTLVGFIAVLTPRFVLADDWDLNKATRAEGGAIVKLCEVGGSRMRYSNVPVQGYEPCGTLKTKAVCDAVGKKLIIDADAEAPHGYLDCSIGPRIVVQRLDGPLEPAQPASGPQPLGEGAWLVGGKEPDKGTAAWNEYQEHVGALDRLLNKKGPRPEGKQAAPAPDTLDPAALFQLLAEVLNEKPGSTKEIEKLLKPLNGGKLPLAGQLPKELEGLFPDGR